MEMITLQQRIEARAEKRLLEDLLKMTGLQYQIKMVVGDSYPGSLDASEYYNDYTNPKRRIRLNNDYTKRLFDELMPKYVAIITDEILQKIDEIDYLLDTKQQEEIEY